MYPEENFVDVIKGLIESCRDEQAGFLIASEHTRNSELRTFFTSQSMERARFAAELAKVAHQLGLVEISRNSGMADRINRAWQDLKSRLITGDAGVLDLVEAMERHARDRYQRALLSGLPAEAQTIVERQAESVSASYEQVCAVRDMSGRAA